MKTRILLAVLFFSIVGFAQDSLKVGVLHTQVFSLSPISKKVDKVNGLVFGVGHIDNKKIENQTINGLNVELNPAPIAGAFIGFLMIIHLPEIIKNRSKDSLVQHDFKIKNWDTKPNLKLNGVNLSTGCFFTSTTMNGLNISIGNKFKNFNGLSLAPLGTIADKQNGISVGCINANTNLNGAVFGLYNQTYQLKGLEFGLVNQVQNNKGIQIGIFNKSYSNGLQIGFWNKNKRRTLPLINW